VVNNSAWLTLLFWIFLPSLVLGLAHYSRATRLRKKQLPFH
jgi:hypothetical protein